METTYNPFPGVKQAMEIQEVILRTIGGRLKWFQAAEVLRTSGQRMRR